MISLLWSDSRRKGEKKENSTKGGNNDTNIGVNCRSHNQTFKKLRINKKKLKIIKIDKLPLQDHNSLNLLEIRKNKIAKKNNYLDKHSQKNQWFMKIH